MRRLSLLLTLTAAAVFAQQIPDAVIKDPPQPADRKFAASMVELQVPVLDASGKPVGEKMNGILYLAAGPGPHPTVLLLHGFPGNEQNLDLAQSVRRAGWNVLYFHYRGAWGSQGDFTFSHAVEDTLSGVRFLHEAENAKKYRIDPDRIVLIGHSMGGFMAASTAANTVRESRDQAMTAAGPHISSIAQQRQVAVAGVVLISPWDLGHTGAFLTAKADNKRIISGVITEWSGYRYSLHGFTAERGIAEARAHAKDWQLAGFVQPIVQRKIPVLLTYGRFEDAREEGFSLLRDAFQSAEQTAGTPAEFTATVLPTDHAYSGQRIALQAVVVNWLERFKSTMVQ